MAVLKIIQIPDERLKRASEPVKVFDDALRSFIDDLEETRQAGPGAVGIAAPQVGWFQRIVIVDDVMTTGATGSSMAQALLTAGAKRVDLWCIARTPAPRN